MVNKTGLDNFQKKSDNSASLSLPLDNIAQPFVKKIGKSFNSTTSKFTSKNNVMESDHYQLPRIYQALYISSMMMYIETGK